MSSTLVYTWYMIFQVSDEEFESIALGTTYCASLLPGKQDKIHTTAVLGRHHIVPMGEERGGEVDPRAA